MSWEKPFQQTWSEPVDDVKQRFGPMVPSFLLREVALMMGLFLLTMISIVGVLELYG
ncbi:MAG TPA: hypothetical protein VKA37_11075 [Halobacteriales archaeon]|nr:hypothetical protein [Halobacteriales archaeon]